MLKYIFQIILVISLLSCAETTTTSIALRAEIEVRKHPEPILSQPLGLVSDPSVVFCDGAYFMIYSEYLLSIDSIQFNAVVSDDGVDFRKVDESDQFNILKGNPGTWETYIETPDFNIIDNDVYLYYVGYPESNFDNGIYNAQIGLVRGSGLRDIDRFNMQPIIKNGTAIDKDAMTSPAVVYHDNLYYMIYTGWSDILTGNGFLGLTAATSTDGITWQRENKPVFPEVANSLFETATEAEYVKGPDGMFYLLFSAEGGIALARSSQPLGPWEIYPEFIIQPELDWEAAEVVAPSMVIDEDKARIWYTAAEEGFQGSVLGYAEMDFPFHWD